MKQCVYRVSHYLLPSEISSKQEAKVIFEVKKFSICNNNHIENNYYKLWSGKPFYINFEDVKVNFVFHFQDISGSNSY